MSNNVILKGVRINWAKIFPRNAGFSMGSDGKPSKTNLEYSVDLLITEDHVKQLLEAGLSEKVTDMRTDEKVDRYRPVKEKKIVNDLDKGRLVLPFKQEVKYKTEHGAISQAVTAVPVEDRFGCFIKVFNKDGTLFDTDKNIGNGSIGNLVVEIKEGKHGKIASPRQLVITELVEYGNNVEAPPAEALGDDVEAPPKEATSPF